MTIRLLNVYLTLRDTVFVSTYVYVCICICICCWVSSVQFGLCWESAAAAADAYVSVESCRGEKIGTFWRNEDVNSLSGWVVRLGVSVYCLSSVRAGQPALLCSALLSAAASALASTLTSSRPSAAGLCCWPMLLAYAALWPLCLHIRSHVQPSQEQ